jgi:hypothetical protein
MITLRSTANKLEVGYVHGETNAQATDVEPVFQISLIVWRWVQGDSLRSNLKRILNLLWAED